MSARGERGIAMANGTTNICLIGNKFMGRAHANACLKVNKFFKKLPSQAVMQTEVALAHQLVKEGKLGRIYHIRAFYLQDWATPDVPLIWRFSKKVSGSGSHGDLGAHIIDMARFITGEEFTTINGAIQETFVKER